MYMQTALLPNSHVPLRKCIVALAGQIRALPAKPRTLDELWVDLNLDASPRPGSPSLDDVVHALDVLFALKQVTMLDDGRRFILKADAMSQSTADSGPPTDSAGRQAAVSLKGEVSDHKRKF